MKKTLLNTEDALSILVCTAARPGYLANLLNSLYLATLQKQPTELEIVIVDNAGDGSALPVVKGFSEKLSIRYFHEPQGNLSEVRNFALQVASHDCCLFLDDDQLVNSDFFSQLIETTRHTEQFSAIRLKLAWKLEHSCPIWLKLALVGEEEEPTSFAPTPLKRTEMGTGGLLLSRTQFTEKNLAFRSELGRCGGEDVDLFLRATSRGLSFAKVAQPTVVECLPAARISIRYALKSSFRKGYVDAILATESKSQANRFRYAFRTMMFFIFSVFSVLLTLLKPSHWLVAVSQLWRQVGKLKSFANRDLVYYQTKTPHVLHLTGGGQDGGAEKILEQISLHVSPTQQNLSFFFYDSTGNQAFAPVLKKNWSQIEYYKKLKSIDFRLWIKLVQFIRKNHINVVHTHDIGAMLHASVAKIFCPSLRLVHTEHTIHYWIETRKYQILYGVLSRFYRHIACVSSFVRTRLLENIAINPKLLTVVPNGVDTKTLLRAAEAAKVKPHKVFQIISVSRIDELKNISQIIRAIHLLKTKGISVKLTHVGTGQRNDVDQLHQSIKELSLEQDVELAGYQTNVADWIANADCFVSASRVECHPVSVLEAMACGKPCVLSDIPPHRELEQNGIILFGNSTDDLALQLQNAMNQKESYPQFAQQLIKAAASRYSISAMLTQYHRLYSVN